MPLLQSISIMRKEPRENILLLPMRNFIVEDIRSGKSEFAVDLKVRPRADAKT